MGALGELVLKNPFMHLLTYLDNYCTSNNKSKRELGYF